MYMYVSIKEQLQYRKQAMHFRLKPEKDSKETDNCIGESTKIVCTY